MSLCPSLMETEKHRVLALFFCVCFVYLVIPDSVRRIVMLSYFLCQLEYFLGFFYGGAGGGTQGLDCTGQVLYHGVGASDCSILRED